MLNFSKFVCENCGFEFFHNVAATASMILMCQGKVLFSVRGNEPSKGLLDFPGGFVDEGESVEEAFVREMEEELGWVPENFQYAFSCPNIYLYQSVKYNTSDLFYFAEEADFPPISANDDVAALKWIGLDEVKEEELAFDSMKLAVSQLKEFFGVA